MKPEQSIEFTAFHVLPIRQQRKTATVRLGDDAAEVSVGDRVDLETNHGNWIAEARITSVAETFVGGALDAIEVFQAGYPTETTEALVQALQGHYNREVSEGTTCRVICWELTDNRHMSPGEGSYHCVGRLDDGELEEIEEVDAEQLAEDLVAELEDETDA